MSQRELAEQIDVSAAYISKVESVGEGMGKESALRTLERFRAELDQLEITLVDLLRGSTSAEAAAG